MFIKPRRMRLYSVCAINYFAPNVLTRRTCVKTPHITISSTKIIACVARSDCISRPTRTRTRCLNDCSSTFVVSLQAVRRARFASPVLSNINQSVFAESGFRLEFVCSIRRIKTKASPGIIGPATIIKRFNGIRFSLTSAR